MRKGQATIRVTFKDRWGHSGNLQQLLRQLEQLYFVHDVEVEDFQEEAE